MRTLIDDIGGFTYKFTSQGGYTSLDVFRHRDSDSEFTAVDMLKIITERYANVHNKSFPIALELGTGLVITK